MLCRDTQLDRVVLLKYRPIVLFGSLRDYTKLRQSSHPSNSSPLGMGKGPGEPSAGDTYNDAAKREFDLGIVSVLQGEI